MGAERGFVKGDEVPFTVLVVIVGSIVGSVFIITWVRYARNWLDDQETYSTDTDADVPRDKRSRGTLIAVAVWRGFWFGVFAAAGAVAVIGFIIFFIIGILILLGKFTPPPIPQQ